MFETSILDNKATVASTLLGVLVAIGVGTLAGCEKGEGGANVEMERQSLEFVDLSAELPKGAALKKSVNAVNWAPSGDRKTAGVSIQERSEGDLEVDAKKEEIRKKYSSEKKDLQSSDVEQRDDGWILKATKKGPEGSTLYFWSVKRTIDGTSYECSGDTSKESVRNVGIEICKSLQPPKG